METPWKPPWPDPSTSPLALGLEPLHPRPDPSTSLWVWASRPTRHAGIPPPPLWTEFLTQLLKILPWPNFVAGGKDTEHYLASNVDLWMIVIYGKTEIVIDNSVRYVILVLMVIYVKHAKVAFWIQFLMS